MVGKTVSEMVKLLGWQVYRLYPGLPFERCFDTWRGKMRSPFLSLSILLEGTLFISLGLLDPGNASLAIQYHSRRHVQEKYGARKSRLSGVAKCGGERRKDTKKSLLPLSLLKMLQAHRVRQDVR